MLRVHTLIRIKLDCFFPLFGLGILITPFSITHFRKKRDCWKFNYPIEDLNLESALVIWRSDIVVQTWQQHLL